jgi:hypothetical protein
MFKQYVVTNGIYESAEPFRFAYPVFLAQRREEPGKGLLSRVFHLRPGIHAFAQLQTNEFAEIGDKMLLRPEVSGAEALQVELVESVKLH